VLNCHPCGRPRLPVTEGDRRAWQSAGYFVTWTNSIREAIEWFRVGDFDLVLLGGSIPLESRERLAFLIRASGSNTPVVSIVDSSADCDAFAEARASRARGGIQENWGDTGEQHTIRAKGDSRDSYAS